MSPVVRVDDDVWEWLKTQARPLEDTPNSVLRRVAGIDPPLDRARVSGGARLRPVLSAAEIDALDDRVEAEAADAAAEERAEPGQRRITGEWLNKAFRLDARHALYHRDGTLYERLTRFPGVLCDRGGYVRYEAEDEFLEDEQLSIGEKVNVPNALAEHPRYQPLPAVKKRQPARA